MFAMQYSHRLPADYEMPSIRRRAEGRAAFWDNAPGLVFKAFIAQERGAHGAVGNLYASLYLWLDPQVAAGLLMGDGFRTVIDSFGRPTVETWLPLDARRGRASAAKTLYRDEIAIEAAADHTALNREAVAYNRELADHPGTVAVFTALDARNWRLVRFTLSGESPQAGRDGAVYEVYYLAQPGLGQLP
ncbi:MAG: hypothetical protein JWN73_4481 [Betaproteobacteria bacterium]|nr:hypothetical protein [Betaproteobacteria bacterium]